MGWSTADCLGPTFVEVVSGQAAMEWLVCWLYLHGVGHSLACYQCLTSLKQCPWPIVVIHVDGIVMVPKWLTAWMYKLTAANLPLGCCWTSYTNACVKTNVKALQETGRVKIVQHQTSLYKHEANQIIPKFFDQCSYYATHTFTWDSLKHYYCKCLIMYHPKMNHLFGCMMQH